MLPDVVINVFKRASSRSRSRSRTRGSAASSRAPSPESTSGSNVLKRSSRVAAIENQLASIFHIARESAKVTQESDTRTTIVASENHAPEDVLRDFAVPVDTSQSQTAVPLGVIFEQSVSTTKIGQCAEADSDDTDNVTSINGAGHEVIHVLHKTDHANSAELSLEASIPRGDIGCSSSDADSLSLPNEVCAYTHVRTSEIEPLAPPAILGNPLPCSSAYESVQQVSHEMLIENHDPKVMADCSGSRARVVSTPEKHHPHDLSLSSFGSSYPQSLNNIYLPSIAISDVSAPFTPLASLPEPIATPIPPHETIPRFQPNAALYVSPSEFSSKDLATPDTLPCFRSELSPSNSPNVSPPRTSSTPEPCPSPNFSPLTVSIDQGTTTEAIGIPQPSTYAEARNLALRYPEFSTHILKLPLARPEEHTDQPKTTLLSVSDAPRVNVLPSFDHVNDRPSSSGQPQSDLSSQSDTATGSSSQVLSGSVTSIVAGPRIDTVSNSKSLALTNDIASPNVASTAESVPERQWPAHYKGQAHTAERPNWALAPDEPAPRRQPRPRGRGGGRGRGSSAERRGGRHQHISRARRGHGPSDAFMNVTTTHAPQVPNAFGANMGAEPTIDPSSLGGLRASMWATGNIPCTIGVAALDGAIPVHMMPPGQFRAEETLSKSTTSVAALGQEALVRARSEGRLEPSAPVLQQTACPMPGGSFATATPTLPAQRRVDVNALVDLLIKSKISGFERTMAPERSQGNGGINSSQSSSFTRPNLDVYPAHPGDAWRIDKEGILRRTENPNTACIRDGNVPLSTSATDDIVGVIPDDSLIRSHERFQWPTDYAIEVQNQPHQPRQHMESSSTSLSAEGRCESRTTESDGHGRNGRGPVNIPEWPIHNISDRPISSRSSYGNKNFVLPPQPETDATFLGGDQRTSSRLHAQGTIDRRAPESLPSASLDDGARARSPSQG
ncbi:hypothetical protein AcW1_004971 [Taiwanofungus camphoratus]|nr:hypothetical protein AcW1_004971 [Antrodia cinnamomea]